MLSRKPRLYLSYNIVLYIPPSAFKYIGETYNCVNGKVYNIEIK